MDEPLLAPLARWCAGDGAKATGDRLRERVAMAVLDWIGALAAGRDEPAAAIYAAYARATDPQAASLPEDAFRLGALSHLAEVDDGHRAAMLHPGVVTIAPIMAIARTRSLDIGTMRAAIAAGYEASVRLGAAFGPDHYRTFHSTATAGGFGAAAAAGRCLGLDANGMLDAFGHAGTQAAGVWQFADDGAEAAKAAHTGFAARNGLVSASLAQAGLAGATRILEGPRGLAAAWSATFDPAPLADVTPPSALEGSTVKAWPVCGQMHHVLDAVQDFESDAAARVESVRIDSFEALSRIAGLRHPTTPAQARFSTTWCVAQLLVHGTLGMGLFREDSVVADPDVQAVAERIALHSDDGFTTAFPTRRGCRVTIRWTDGTESVREGWGRRGDPERPFSRDEMQSRFADVAAGAHPDWRRRVLAVIERLETGGPFDLLEIGIVRELTDG